MSPKRPLREVLASPSAFTVLFFFGLALLLASFLAINFFELTQFEEYLLKLLLIIGAAFSLKGFVGHFVYAALKEVEDGRRNT